MSEDSSPSNSSTNSSKTTVPKYNMFNSSSPTPRPLAPGYTRTTKETHPDLPPGLVLDPDGKVCKVCNSWKDMGMMKVRKKVLDGKGDSDGNGNGSSKDTDPSGSNIRSGTVFGSMAGLIGSSSTSKASKSTPSNGNSSSVPDTNHPSSSSSSSSSSSTTTTTTTTSSQTHDRSNCPADNIELGRSTWTFLHTTAAYYPLKPTEDHKRNMKNLLNSIGLLYPCGVCAEDFNVDVKENPPDLSGRYGLSKWLCDRHNLVNEKLGKEVFECTWEKLDGRWRDGPADGSCD